MFDTVAGLPVHALVVHAVVVLVPLGAVGSAAVALVPRWDRTYGGLVVAVNLLATVSAFVARASGEALATRVGTPAAHVAVARWLPWFVLALLFFSALLWWADRSSGPRGASRAPRRSSVVRVWAVVTVLAAVAAVVWTVRAGDSGARAVWEPVVRSTVPGSQPLG